MVTIKQGYPRKEVGKLEISDSGWFFNIKYGCKMLHESTIEEIYNKIQKFKEEKDGN